MTSVSTLLIVAMLAGSSVANWVCIGACEDQVIRAASCHKDMTTPVEPIVRRGGTCASTLVSETPFLTEERISLGPSLVMSVPTSGMPTMASVGSSAVTSPATIGWLKNGPVLRL